MPIRPAFKLLRKNSLRMNRKLSFLPIGKVKRRIVLALGFDAAVLALGVLLVGGSIWVESKYVFEPSQSRLIEKVRELATKPIAAAVGNQVQQQLRKRLHSRNEGGLADLGVKANIAGLLNENLSPQLRGVYAYRLARLGTPEALAALLRVFQTAPAQHKPFLAQLLGSTGNPKFKDWLLPLLNDPDEKLAAAAIRGLGTIGGEDIETKLAQILSESNRTDNIRLEAASGLASIGSTAACDALIHAFPEFAKTDSALDLLKILGQFPFPEISPTFTDLLASLETSPQTRVAAVEALAESSSEAVPFLLNLATNNKDSDVRESAVWAISMHGQPGLGPTLAELALREPDADVRRRFYEAMTPQPEVPGNALAPRVLAETDIAARVAGFNALAAAAAQSRSSSLDAMFDDQIVPELQQIAISPNSLNIQMRAVFALRRSGSARAQQALTVIARANSSTPTQVIAAAQHGLLSKQ